MPARIIFIEVSEAEAQAARRDLIRTLERLRQGNLVVKEQTVNQSLTQEKGLVTR